MSYWDRHPGFDLYFAGIYAQTVRALSQIGSPRQVDCALRRYAAAHAYAIATQADLLAALSEVSPRARAILRRYGLGAPGTG